MQQTFNHKPLDQLTGIEGFKPERFKNFTEETTENEIISKGLTKYDDNTYYEDLGVDSSNIRHILVFNSELLVNHRKAREKHILKAMEKLEEEKNSLQSCGDKGMLRCPSNIVLMLRGDSGSCIFVLYIRFNKSGPGLVSKYAFKSEYKLELTGTSRLLISYVFDMIRPPSQEVSQCKHSELLKLTINRKI